MAVPVLITPYDLQTFTVSDPIDIDISPNWSGATSFEIASPPPDTIYASDTTSIVGTATTQMIYTVYIRGVNAAGAADWASLLMVTTGQVTSQVLWGLSVEWQLINPVGAEGYFFIKQATIGAPGNFSETGRLLINDIANDGNAIIYPSNRLYSQIDFDSTENTLARATEPGWELIINTSGLPPANWILATGIWNDSGAWDDSASWID